MRNYTESFVPYTTRGVTRFSDAPYVRSSSNTRTQRVCIGYILLMYDTWAFVGPGCDRRRRSTMKNAERKTFSVSARTGPGRSSGTRSLGRRNVTDRRHHYYIVGSALLSVRFRPTTRTLHTPDDSVVASVVPLPPLPYIQGASRCFHTAFPSFIILRLGKSDYSSRYLRASIYSASVRQKSSAAYHRLFPGGGLEIVR